MLSDVKAPRVDEDLTPGTSVVLQPQQAEGSKEPGQRNGPLLFQAVVCFGISYRCLLFVLEDILLV